MRYGLLLNDIENFSWPVYIHAELVRIRDCPSRGISIESENTSVSRIEEISHKLERVTLTFQRSPDNFAWSSTEEK